LSGLKGNSPVWIIVPDWGWNVEGFGQLGIHHDFRTGIEFADKRALIAGIGKNVIVNVAVGLEPLAQIFLLLLCEDVDGVGLFQWIVRQMLDDHRGFLFINECACLQNEIFRVGFVLTQYGEVDTAQDGGNGPPSELGRFRQLAKKIIFHSVPGGHWNTTTFIAGLRVGAVIAPMVLDGPMDKEAFLVYVREFLCPALHVGDIVIADNLGSHKNDDVREAIEGVGATIRYLPPYSPDFNPIEMVFSKLKALLKKAAHRTVEALWNEIGTLLDAFSPQECANYFKSAGYVSV